MESTLHVRGRFRVWRIGTQGAPVSFAACVAATAAITMYASNPTLQQYWLLLLLAPVLEEIVFRAGLQSGLLARGGLAARYSAVIVAAAFALAHVAHQRQLIAATTALPALAIGVVYARSRSLVACSVLHAGCNAVWLVTAASLSSVFGWSY